MSNARSLVLTTEEQVGQARRTLVEARRRPVAMLTGSGSGGPCWWRRPNEGTPLASPVRWETLPGWIANLDEIVPDNP